MQQFKLIAELSKLIQDFLDEHIELFATYEKIIVYYDNGQKQLTGIVAALLNDDKVEFRHSVSPMKYRLFQIADLITTLELINVKRQANAVSRSELHFFGSMNAYNKNYFKKIIKKRL